MEVRIIIYLYFFTLALFLLSMFATYRLFNKSNNTIYCKNYRFIRTLFLIINILLFEIILSVARQVVLPFNTISFIKENDSLFGSILGSFATILAVVLTIRHSDKRSMQEREEKYMPKLQHKIIAHSNIKADKIDGTLFFVKSKKPLEGLREDIRKNSNTLISITRNDLKAVILKWEIMNVGEYAAVNVNFGCCSGELKYKVNYLTILPGETKELYFKCDTFVSERLLKSTLTFQNIYNVEYAQDFHYFLKLSKSGTSKLILVNFEKPEKFIEFNNSGFI